MSETVNEEGERNEHNEIQKLLLGQDRIKTGRS